METLTSNIKFESIMKIQTALSYPENKRVLRALDQFAKNLNRYGFNIEVYTERSLCDLNSLSATKKDAIAAYFENWSRWIEPNAIEPYHIEITEEKSRNFLLHALKHYGLHVSDEFLTTIKEDHLIEIYGEDMIQMYRSINFFKYCGYTLLEISIYEWYLLWERPARILEKMHSNVLNTMSNALPVMKMNVPKHINREIMQNQAHGFVASAYGVDFQYMGCLKTNPLQKKSVAFICSSKAELIGRGTDASNIEFL